MSDQEIFYAWIDLETTGLLPDEDFVLELAIEITDANLYSIGAYHTPVLPNGPWMDQLDLTPFVLKMHQENGLLEEVINLRGLTYPELQDDVLQLFDETCGTDKQAVIAGNSVAGFDLLMVKAQLPRIATCLHPYHTMDISPMRRFIQWTLKRPDLLPPEIESPHRAMPDVRNSLRHARHFMEVFGTLPLQPMIDPNQQRLDV